MLKATHGRPVGNICKKKFLIEMPDNIANEK